MGVGNTALGLIPSHLYGIIAWPLILCPENFFFVDMPLRQVTRRLKATRHFQKEGNFFVGLVLTSLFSRLITHLVNWFN